MYVEAETVGENHVLILNNREQLCREFSEFGDAQHVGRKHSKSKKCCVVHEGKAENFGPDFEYLVREE